MDEKQPILIAGAGIAGLTMALALAQHGLKARIYEREHFLSEAGAGVQLSPNATRLLAQLGVLPALARNAVEPHAAVLKRAQSLRELARIPLGAEAYTRWHAPYLTVHRADLQSVLLGQLRKEKTIELVTGAALSDITLEDSGLTVEIARGWIRERVRAALLIGADGVWSNVRETLSRGPSSRFTGHMAFRATLTGKTVNAMADTLPPDQVTALLDPAFHLVAYPLRGGSMINLVAVVPEGSAPKGWSQEADDTGLRALLEHRNPALARLNGEIQFWTAWPIHVSPRRLRWSHGGRVALIGDAAHAMTPFAAQGAAMAIEDAVVLARLIAQNPDAIPVALSAYERIRQPRLGQVLRRGALNKLAWHAAGPVALARDAALRLRGNERLAADLDWLYGFDAQTGRALAQLS